jgi:putative SOS response-associated peptidase YedK
VDVGTLTWNPTQAVLAVRTGKEGKPELARLRWGLVPAWAADLSVGNRLINARAETVKEKPAFRAAFQRRRCLVLTDGFYEWQKTDSKHKQPYYFRLRDGSLFAFAGLWERWDRGDDPVESCALVTTGANDLMQPVHDRMPVILPKAEYEHWLDPTAKDLPQLQGLLRPYPSEKLTAYPVGKHVNNPRHDDALCIAPQAGTGAAGPT